MHSEVNPRSVRALARMLIRMTTETAFGRLEDEAREAKQSVREIAQRRASNILRSLSLRQAV